MQITRKDGTPVEVGDTITDKSGAEWIYHNVTARFLRPTQLVTTVPHGGVISFTRPVRDFSLKCESELWTEHAGTGLLRPTLCVG
jgi:hypothetical protein